MAFCRLAASLVLTMMMGSADAREPAVLLPASSEHQPTVHHLAFSLEYSEYHEQAAWVAYVVDGDRLRGTIPRTDNFRPDLEISSGSSSLADYRRSGFDRGHLAPAALMKWSRTAMSESFLMSNMSPQRPAFNRGIWKKLEALVRTWGSKEDRLHVVTGPVLTEGLATIGPNHVSVPDYFFKVILDYQVPDYKAIGFVLPNRASKAPLRQFSMAVDDVEELTGHDFYPELEDALENQLEATADFRAWPAGEPASRRGKVPPERRSIRAEMEAAATVVYVTPSGKKYHTATCRYVKKTKQAIGRRRAREDGYDPCKVCKPGW
jgi:endonuclease G